MKKLLLSMTAVPCIIGGLHVSANADEGINILNNVQFNGEIRPRYEYVDDKNRVGDTANAFTARTSLGINADLLGVNGLSTYIEGTTVNNFGYTNYNGTINGNTKYDIIADPQQARMTQAYIDYKFGKTLIRAGRQIINLDNQRFIGAVDWRQMFQTFDALTIVDHTVDNLSLTGAYIYGINGVKSQSLGTASNNEAYDTSSLLFNAKYKVVNELSVTVYNYMLASINDTYGLALTGNIDTDSAKLDYRAEYARQNDATMQRRSESGGSPTVLLDGKPQADAYYYNFDVSANISGLIAGLNYELLSGTNGHDGKTAFSTPLATLHGFNGWADVFLNTPTGGLIDASIRVGYTNKSIGNLMAVYHKFDADKGNSKDLGSELDLSYGNKIPKINNLTGLIKGAFYTGGDVTGFTSDKRAAWLMLDYKFAIK